MSAQTEKMFKELNDKITELDRKVDIVLSEARRDEKEDVLMMNKIFDTYRKELCALQEEVKALSNCIIKTQKDAKLLLESE